MASSNQSGLQNSAHASSSFLGAEGGVNRGRPTKRQNVSKACLNCRKRKSRCDGAEPICGGCARLKFQCAWASAEDGRKAISKSYVNALKARIRDLENIIELQGGLAPPGAIIDAGSDSDNESNGARDGTDEVSQAIGNLLFNGGGEAEVSVYGPTSAFHHLSRSSGYKDQEPLARSQDHRRYLPIEVPISATQHTIVLDRFFRFFASWALRVPPGSFHRDLVTVVTSPFDQPAPRTHCYSPLLHNAILSVALVYADEEELKSYEVRRIFANEAQKHAEREGQKPTLASVQGFAILSTFHSTLGGHSHGWLAFGLAPRAAEALGLNVDCSSLVTSGKLSVRDNKERIHTFWTVFIQEQLWAVYIGRAHTVMDFSTPLPEVDEKVDKMPWKWDQARSRMTGGPTGSQPSMMSTAFVESAKLAILISEIMCTVYGWRKCNDGLGKIKAVSDLRLSLERWYAELPNSVELSVHSYKNALPHILTLHLAHEWLQILLHRPSYRPVVNMSGSQRRVLDQDSINYAVKICDHAAARMLQLLKQWHSLFDLANCNPTIPQIAFTAGTTHLLAAVQHRSPKRHKEAIVAAQDCVNLLRRIGVSWTSGTQKADILENLINEYVCARPQPASTSEKLASGVAANPAATSSISSTSYPFGTPGEANPFSSSLAIESGNFTNTGIFAMDFSSFSAQTEAEAHTIPSSIETSRLRRQQPEAQTLLSQQTSMQLWQQPHYQMAQQVPVSKHYENFQELNQPEETSQLKQYSQDPRAMPSQNATCQDAVQRFNLFGQQSPTQPIDSPAQNRQTSEQAARESSFVGPASTDHFWPNHQQELQQQGQQQLPNVTPEFFQALLHHMGLGSVTIENMPAPSAFVATSAPSMQRPTEPAFNPYLSSSLQSPQDAFFSQLFEQVSSSPTLVQPPSKHDHPRIDTASGSQQHDPPQGHSTLPWANFFGSAQ